MFEFLLNLFSPIPSTQKYENKLKELENQQAAGNAVPWKITFADDFDNASLNPQWGTKPAGGEKIGKTYSLESDLQYTTDGRNISLGGSTAKIITQRERAEGLCWNEKYGFKPTTFDYTSGILTTARSFRQAQGRFEAKIRVPKAQGTYHSFWLGRDITTPHINVCYFQNGKMFVGVFVNNQQIIKRIPRSLTNDFYIFGIEWNNEKIAWTVNGKKIYSVNIRMADPLYVAFASGVRSQTNANLPISLDIDWIKCYQRN